MTRHSYVVGVGESAFTRRAGVPYSHLQIDAIERAFAECDVTSDDIDAVIVDAGVVPRAFPTDEAIAAFGLSGVHQVIEAPRGIAQAGQLATLLIRAGIIDNALVYGGADWGSLQGGPYGFHERWPTKLSWERPVGYYGQPTYYAALASAYVRSYDVAEDHLELALARLAVDTRINARTHPNSQLTVELDLDSYLAGEMVARPLRRDDCSLVTDGAAAFVLSVDATRGRHGPVRVSGCAHAEDSSQREEELFSQWAEPPRLRAATASSQSALAEAGATLADVDVALLYDCFTISALLEIEAIGWCGPGEGADFLGDRRTTFDGDFPVNTHGGLIANGHVVGANHLAEAVRQLRHERQPGQVANAEVALVSMPPNRYHTSLVLTRGA